jgi:hypothetical protein
VGTYAYECVDFTCKECKIDPDDGPEQLLVHAKMWQLGDKYFVDGLKDLAAVKFEIAANRYWNTEAFVAAVEFVVANELGDDAYKSPRRALCRMLSRRRELWKKEGIEKVLKGDGEFAYDVMICAESGVGKK